MRLTLRSYQQEDVRVIVNAPDGGCLVANQVGTGKTLTAIMAIIEATQEAGDARRVLIIAPLNTHVGWERTIRAQLGEDTPIHRVLAKSISTETWQRLLDREPGWFLIGWEAFRGTPSAEQRAVRKKRAEVAKALGRRPPPQGLNLDWSKAGEFDAVVADECHRAQNRRSTTAMTLWTLDAHMRIAMSATPAGNSIEGIWAICHWLWPNRFPNFWPWAEQHLKVVPDPYSGRRIDGERIKGSVRRAFPAYTRRLQREVNSELPEVIERVVEVEMSPAQRRIYWEFEDQALAWLNGHPVATPLPITQRLRLRQVALGVPTVIPSDEVDEEGFPKVEVTFAEDAKSSKISTLIEIVSDLPPNEPVLIFTHSARFVAPVVHQLNKKKLGQAVAWTGETKQEMREEYLRTFGRGGPRFIVAGIAAIGEGVDGLQHVCASEIWLSQHDNNLLNLQAQGRLLRMGQRRPVNRWLIQTTESIDQRVYLRLAENTEAMAFAYGDVPDNIKEIHDRAPVLLD